MATRHPLTMTTLNPNIKKMAYAVRGPVVTRACEIEDELRKGLKKPFDAVVKADIGDAHAMGQTPITFIRQVLALVNYPPLLNEPLFPADAKQRARAILGACKAGSVGAYTESAGIELIRRHVADYIERRDGIPSDWRNIVLTTGGSEAIRSVLRLLLSGAGDDPVGVMVPVPMFPLYSVTLTEYGMHRVDYYPDEDNDWALDVSELERAAREARKICALRAIVVINPGNPTGQVLTRGNIEEIIRFAHREKLFVLADEVYQQNVYGDGVPFVSFKKALSGMPCRDDVQIASFMSCSKGYAGECGARGGYVELINVSSEVMAEYLKSVVVNMCPAVSGQACLEAIVNPPAAGEPSFESYREEKARVLASLELKARMVTDALSSVEGFSCNSIRGAMYAFPRLRLPPKAAEAAAERGLEPDTFYAFRLLEETGLCVVPGNNFGQKPGTYHFRMTILPSPGDLHAMLRRLASFHAEFMRTYS
ncbi:alanine aminotransferase 1-like [Cylas formicarius]|uniref:alanine aminotransferase 1-like n=1 Tax=Cylas formicarius TaxID=197179 RepID=UPI002958B604|nr:alanine aminotransferase 1-like [Cylas formicarius]